MFVSSTLMRSTCFPAATVFLSNWFHQRHATSTSERIKKKNTGVFGFGILISGPKNGSTFKDQQTQRHQTGPFWGPENGPTKLLQKLKKKKHNIFYAAAACFRRSASERPFCFFTVPNDPCHRLLNRRTHWILLLLCVARAWRRCDVVERQRAIFFEYTFSYKGASPSLSLQRRTQAARSHSCRNA